MKAARVITPWNNDLKFYFLLSRQSFEGKRNKSFCTSTRPQLTFKRRRSAMGHGRISKGAAPECEKGVALECEKGAALECEPALDDRKKVVDLKENPRLKTAARWWKMRPASLRTARFFRDAITPLTSDLKYRLLPNLRCWEARRKKHHEGL